LMTYSECHRVNLTETWKLYLIRDLVFPPEIESNIIVKEVL